MGFARARPILGATGLRMIPFLLAIVIAEAIAIVTMAIAPFGEAAADSNLLLRFWSWSTHDAVAVYTLILSVSTIALWAATRRSAQIAERALSEVERPWLFVQGATVTRRDMPPVPLTPNFWYISFKCKNVGRSPAVMQECIIKLDDKDLLPPTPDYSNAPPFATQRWVSPGEEFELSPWVPET